MNLLDFLVSLFPQLHSFSVVGEHIASDQLCAVFHHSFPILLLFLIHLYVVLHPFETIVIFHYFSFIKV